MGDYRVNLEIFAGPMDLLLYLVRKEEVDIYDISISKITEQYIRYMGILRNLDIDLAGDFLVMAATLMQIKSVMLLPRSESVQIDGEDLADPRAELIRQLLEYKKFKDAANLLNAAADEQNQRHARPDSIIERLKPESEPQIDIEQVSIWDLLEAFDSIMKATGAVKDISFIKDDTPIDLYQIQILHHLQQDGPLTFERLFEGTTEQVVMVGLFLALLELVREGLVWAEQDESSASIYLRPLTEEPAEEAVKKAILATADETAQNQSDVTERKHKPPVPIDELPPKGKPATASEEYEKVESAKDNEQQKTK